MVKESKFHFLALPQNNPGTSLGLWPKKCLMFSNAKCHCGWPPKGHPQFHLGRCILYGEIWKPRQGTTEVLPKYSGTTSHSPGISSQCPDSPFPKAAAHLFSDFLLFPPSSWETANIRESENFYGSGLIPISITTPLSLSRS